MIKKQIKDAIDTFCEFVVNCYKQTNKQTNKQTKVHYARKEVCLLFKHYLLLLYLTRGGINLSLVGDYDG